MPPKTTIDVILSAEQVSVVESNSRAILVVASAGSGKTEVVARRVQRLLEGAQATSGKILALSYTVQAADELRLRLHERAGGLTQFVDTETIHGFAHSLLRQHGTKLGLPIEPELLTRDEDRVELMNQWRGSQGLGPLTDPLAALRKIDLLRAKLTAHQDVDDWESALESVSALDYPALLSAARRLMDLRSTRRQLERIYSHIIVDEAQNLTPAQYDLISSVIGKPNTDGGPSTMFVGDDKQSIISFAGADPDLLKLFADEYNAVTIRLNSNFRSAQKISNLATRVAKALGNTTSSHSTHAAQGIIEYHDGADERHEARIVADWVENLLTNGIQSQALASSESNSIRPEEIAVLGRSGTALRHIAPELTKREISFSIASGTNDWLESTAGKVALEIISLKSASEHQSTHWQLARLLNSSPNDVSTPSLLKKRLLRDNDSTLRMLTPLTDSTTVSEFIDKLKEIPVPEETKTQELSAWTADLDQILSCWHEFDQLTDRTALTWGNFRVYCSRQQRGETGPGVRLLTIHKSQGQEFRAVALVGLNQGQLPDFRAKTPESEEAELRTFYVAVTRSRRVLLLTRPKSRMTRYGSRSSDPSEFLSYLG
ncbi:ATP-dependent helicase [Rhodococcus erythropolis]|uniref:ATP-dependent helicase n=1 Tax=Rhodococcus erythropolis TaxID=1833 RepID=UPI00339FD859